MKRGHAEALMPLIARVMQQADIAFAALDRIAVTTGPGSFTGLRVGISAARGIALAAHKPAVGLTTLAAYAAPHRRRATASIRSSSAIDARHDHVYLQVVSGHGGPLVTPRVAPIARSVRRLALRRAASGRQCRRMLASAGRRTPPPPRQGRSRSPRPTSAGWRGSAPRSIRRRDAAALLSARAGCKAAGRPMPRAKPQPHDGLAVGLVARRRTAVVEPATPRDAARLAQLHGASFHRGWGEGEFEAMLSERNTLVHRAETGPQGDRLCGVAHGRR